MRRWMGLSLGLAIVLAIGMTWPLAAGLDSRLAGRAGDAEEFLWVYWWFHQALLRHISPFATDMLYAPDGTSLRFHTTNTLHALLSVPLQPLLGLVATFNLVALLSFITACLTMTALAYDVSRSRAGALIAGIAFAFAPTQVFHWQVGQLNVLAVEFLPLGILAIHRLLDPERPALRAVLLTAVTFAAASLCDWQFGVYLALYGLLAFAGALLRSRARRALVLRAGAAALLAGLALAAYIIPMVAELTGPDPYMLRSEADTIYHAADVLEFFLPNPASPFWGGWASAVRAGLHPAGIVSTVVSISYVTLVLALLGGIWRWKQARWWLGSGLLFAVLALGPRLKVAGTQTDVPLPYLALFQLKIVQVSRVPARYALVTLVCLAVLAALGVAALLERVRSRRIQPALVGLILLVLLVELWPAPGAVTPLAPAPRFYTDGTLADAGGILEQPDPSNRGMFYQTLHGRPVAWGELSRDNPTTPLLRALRAGPPASDTPEILDAAANWSCLAAAAGYTHLVRYPPAPPLPALRLVTHLQSDPYGTLYALENSGSRATCVWLDTGFVGDVYQMDDGTPYRWIGQSARLALVRRTPGQVRLQLMLYCFAGPRHIQIVWNDTVLAEQTNCGWPPQPLALKLDIPSGWLWLEVRSVEPATNPADVGYTDPKAPISAGLSRLSVEP